MSNTQFAFLKRSSVPSRDALQASIKALGFGLTLHPEFTPFEDEGFSPCIFNGIADVGFEVFYEPASDIIEDDEDLQEIAGDNDFCISMVWRSSMKDYACVMIVSCALAKDFGAVISYEGEKAEQLETLIKNTISIIKEAESEA
jgi:hypothetical protein